MYFFLNHITMDEHYIKNIDKNLQKFKNFAVDNTLFHTKIYTISTPSHIADRKNLKYQILPVALFKDTCTRQYKSKLDNSTAFKPTRDSEMSPHKRTIGPRRVKSIEKRSIVRGFAATHPRTTFRHNGDDVIVSDGWISVSAFVE